MTIEVEGYNLNELVKLLYRKKIVLQNLYYKDETHIQFDIEDNEHAKVKRYILNYKVKLGLSKLKKLPKFMLTNLGIILGVFFGGLFYLFASSFTWQICIYGTQELSNAEILQVLNNNGIKKGKINLVSNEDIETILLNNYNRIAQVSVIKKGTAIIINLSEKLVYNEEEYEPIVANYSGIITQINISTGTTNVKVGDYVNVGDVLVLPFNITGSGEKVSVKPLAEIKAKMFVVGSCSLNETEKVLLPSGKKRVEYKYSLFKFNLFSGKNKNTFDFYNTTIYNETVSRLIPFSRQKIVYEELTLQEITHNLVEEQDSLKQKSYNIALNNLPTNYNLVEEKTTSTIVNGTLFANTVITINGIINN